MRLVPVPPGGDAGITLTVPGDSELGRALEHAGIRVAAADGPLRPLDLVECPARGTLLAAACATRHAARVPSGGGRGSAKFPPCAKCAAGALVLARLEASGWQRPSDSLPAETLPNAQRRARLRWLRTFPDHAVPDVQRSDPIAEVASTTRDDPGIALDVG